MKNKKKILVIVMIVSLAGILGTGAYIYVERQTDNGSFTDEDGVVYQPATEQEKKEVEEFKENPDKALRENTPVPSGTVSPVITSWRQARAGSDLLINGYVPGIIEDSGKCTVTLNKGDKNTSATVSGNQNAQNTSCGQITISSAKIEPGEWNAVLSYRSETATGTSSSVKMEVK